MLYFDNAATTKMSDAALSAFLEVAESQYGNPSSSYKFGRNSKELLDEARKIIAKCIGAEPKEIYFTSCGTESDNWVISQIGSSFKRCIISSVEHHAVLNPAKEKALQGMKLEILDVDDYCLIKEECLKGVLNGEPNLVSIILQNNETGTIQDISKLSQLVHDDNKNSIFHTDAVQAVGHQMINVKTLGIDTLSASAHKFNGPKGVGFLYLKQGIQVSPFILGGGQELGMRSGTENVAGIYSMAKALEENVFNMNSIHKHVKSLEDHFLLSLNESGIRYTINGNNHKKALGILNILFYGLDGEGLLNYLDLHDICISIGSACNSKSQNRSHVLKAMNLKDEQIDSSVRISIGRYNTLSEVEELVKRIKKYSEICAITTM